MKVEISRLDIVSVVKVSFVLYAILGIVIGFLYVMVALIFGSLFDYGEAFGASGLLRTAATGFGVLLVPLFALIYGCLGALGGLVFSVIYNLISKTLGGIRVILVGELGVSETGSLDKQSEVRL